MTSRGRYRRKMRKEEKRGTKEDRKWKKMR